MGLKWFEQLDIVDNMLSETERAADNAFAAYAKRMTQLQTQVAQSEKAEQDRQAILASNYAQTQRCAKAEDNLRKLNTKLLKLGISEQIPINSESINRELNSGNSWSSQVLSQVYVDVRESKQAEIRKAAEQDEKKAYEQMSGGQKWSDLPYFDQQARIDARFWEYMKTYYPEYFGILHAEEPEPEPEPTPLAIFPEGQQPIGAEQAKALTPLEQIQQAQAQVAEQPISANERQMYVSALAPVTEKNADTMIGYFRNNPDAFRAALIGEGRNSKTEMLAQHVFGTLGDQQLKDLFSSEAWGVERYTQEMAEDTSRNMKWGTFTAGVGDLVANVGGVFRWLGNDGIGDRLSRFGGYMQAQAEPVPFEPDEFTWKSLFDPRFISTYGLRMLPTLMVLAAGSLIGFGAAAAGAARVTTFGLTRLAGAAPSISALRTAGIVRTILQGIGGAALSRPMESALEAGGAYDEARMKGYSHEDAERMASEVFNNNLKLMGMDAAQLAVGFMPMGTFGQSAIGAVRKGLVKTAQVAGKMAFTGLTEGGEEVFQELILRNAIGEPFDLNDPEIQLVFGLGAMAGIGFGGGSDMIGRITNRTTLEFTQEQQMLYKVRSQFYMKEGAGEISAHLAALADVIEKYPEVASLLKNSAEETAKEVEQEQADKIKLEGLTAKPAEAAAKPVIPEGYTDLDNTLHNRSWAVIAGEKDTKTQAENDKALSTLEKILKRRKKEYYPSRGRELGKDPVERGFFVLDMDEITAAEIGGMKGIDQESIFVPRGQLYTSKSLDLAFDPFDSSKIYYGDDIKQYFTEVDMGGKTYKFSLTPTEGATQGHINKIGQQVTRAGFVRQLRKTFTELEGIKINNKRNLRDSRFWAEGGGTYSFVEIGTKDLAKWTSNPAEQESLFRLIALHEIGHEMAKMGLGKTVAKGTKAEIAREIAAWEWAVAKAREYYLLTPNANKLVEAFMAEAHPELGKGVLLNELRSRGLISALIPDTVKPQTEEMTHGWEGIKRVSVVTEGESVPPATKPTAEVPRLEALEFGTKEVKLPIRQDFSDAQTLYEAASKLEDGLYTAGDNYVYYVNNGEVTVLPEYRSRFDYKTSKFIYTERPLTPANLSETPIFHGTPYPNVTLDTLSYDPKRINYAGVGGNEFDGIYFTTVPSEAKNWASIGKGKGQVLEGRISPDAKVIKYSEVKGRTTEQLLNDRVDVILKYEKAGDIHEVIVLNPKVIKSSEALPQSPAGKLGGRWEIRLVGENSKVILARKILDHKPKVADYVALEKQLKRQQEVKYDSKTGKFMKVKKTVTRINKTNWDILKENPEVRRLIAKGAGFTDAEADAMAGLKFAELTPAQQSAVRASAYTMPSTQKGVAAWNKMSVTERENLITAINKKGRIGALKYGAMSRNEQAALRLAILTDQVGITPDGKLEARSVQPVRPAIDPVQVLSLIQRLTQSILMAKPIQSLQKGLTHQALGEKAARMAQAWETAEGKEAMLKGMAELRGEVPTAEAQFVAPEITPEEETLLYNAIYRDVSKIWTPETRFEQNRTAVALTKVLAGIVPQENEFALLEKQFGSAFVAAILQKRSLGARVWETTADALNLPRALLSSWDLSAPLRQGALLFWGQPRQSIPALWDMVKAFGSEKFTIALEESINTGKFAQLMRDAGLYIAPYKGEAARLVQREEAFMSKLARYIPLVKHSERAYVSYLNKLRADVFTYYANLWEGTEKATMENYTALAHAINVMSGRGDLPSFMRGSAAMWNAFFFSPRFISSRVMLPIELVKTTPAVRKVMVRNIVSMVAANMLMFSLFYLATKDRPDEMTLEVDPRSTDFGKIKIGNTRIDFWGGFQPYARFLVQLGSGTRKYTTTGELNDVDRLDLIGRFVRSKLSPAAGLVTDLLAGETFLGDEFALTEESVKNQAFQRLVPMFVQDMVDAMNDQGMIGIPLAMPSLLGANMQTYGGYTVTQDDLDMLAQQYYRMDWNQLSAEQQQFITAWLGGLK